MNATIAVDSFYITVSGGDETIFPPVTFYPESYASCLGLTGFYAGPQPPETNIPPFGFFDFTNDAPNPFGRPRQLRISPAEPLDGTLTVVTLLSNMAAAELGAGLVPRIAIIAFRLEVLLPEEISLNRLQLQNRRLVSSCFRVLAIFAWYYCRIIRTSPE